MTSLLIVATLGMLAQPGVALPEANVLEEIDARFARGDIDDEARHLLRVAAVKAPARLPDDLRALRQERPAQPAQMSAVLLEAWQWLASNDRRGGQLQALLSPPTDLEHVIDSADLPIRVTYEDSRREGLAQQVLAAAETSWQMEVDDYGFHAPLVEPGSERYRIRLEPTGWGGGGYTSPYDVDPSKQWPACYSYIVIDDENWPEMIDSTVAHELNHAMQASMDCLESIAFYENTATYIMGKVFPRDWYMTVMTFYYFQEQPWRPLSYMDYWESDGYEYGGALLLYYLEDTFAPDDGPALVSRIWEASMQNSFYDNEPDYLDAIAEVVTAAGVADFDTFLGDFSESRFFVGAYADDRHMSGAEFFYDAEVRTVARHMASELPLQELRPSISQRPQPLGSNHLVVDLGGAIDHGLKIAFAGEATTRWQVRAVLSGGAETELHSMSMDSAQAGGALELEPGGHRFLTLVVVNLGDGSFDPDDSPTPGADYQIDIVPAAPLLTEIAPGALRADERGVVLRLLGRGFVDGEGFAVAFDDPDLHLVSIDAVTAEEVTLTLDVAAGIAPGFKAVTVTNPGGEQAQRDDLLEVRAVDEEPEAPGFGCDCTATGGAGGAWALAALLLLRRRRGRR